MTRAIDEAAKTAAAVEVTLDNDDGGHAALSAGQAPAGGATVWLVMFDDGHDTDVGRGENSGRKIHNSNVVRELRPLGTWTGEARVFPLDMAAARAEGRGGCAILVQQGRGGPIIGAAILDLDGVSG